MHRGGISYIRQDYLIIPKHFLFPLNIHNNSSLYGLYYPTPAEYLRDDENSKTIRHDFIFTPIPFELWPFLIQVKIRLSDKVGAIAKVTEIFNALNLNILITDYHHVGHKFSILTAMLELRDISNKYYRKQLYSRKELKKKNEGLYAIYEEVDSLNKEKTKKFRSYIALEKIINKVINEEVLRNDDPEDSLRQKITVGCKEYLFEFDNEDRPRFPKKENVEIIKLLTLPYHYWEAKRDRERRELEKEENESKIRKIDTEIHNIVSKLNDEHEPLKDKTKIELLNERNKLDIELQDRIERLKNLNVDRIPFRAKYVDDKIIFSDSLPAQILDSIGIREGNKTTFAFTNIHDKSARIRISIIPKETINLYKRALFKYQANGKNPTSQGFILKISELLRKKGIRIHNLSNRSFEFQKYSEHGVIEYITQLPESLSGIKESELERDLETNLDLEDTQVKILPINPFRIFVSIVSSFFFRRQFIELCMEVGREVGLLEETFVFVKENIQPTTEVVAGKIRETDGMLQFYIDFAKSKGKFSSWLDAEYLTAVSQNKPVVRITEATQDLVPIVHKDNLSLPISLDDSEEGIRNTIKEALIKLMDAIKKETISRYE